MKTTASAKVRTATKTNVGAEVGKLGIVTMSVGAAVAGLWSLTALVVAMVQVGGPVELVKSWFSAVGLG